MINHDHQMGRNNFIHYRYQIAIPDRMYRCSTYDIIFLMDNQRNYWTIFDKKLVWPLMDQMEMAQDFAQRALVDKRLCQSEDSPERKLQEVGRGKLYVYAAQYFERLSNDWIDGPPKKPRRKRLIAVNP